MRAGGGSWDWLVQEFSSPLITRQIYFSSGKAMHDYNLLSLKFIFCLNVLQKLF